VIPRYDFPQKRSPHRVSYIEINGREKEGLKEGVQKGGEIPESYHCLKILLSGRGTKSTSGRDGLKGRQGCVLGAIEKFDKALRSPAARSSGEKRAWGGGELGHHGA